MCKTLERKCVENQWCIGPRTLETILLRRPFGWVCCAVAMIGLGGCGAGTISGDDDKGCKPFWECEHPLNGNEADGCGNRRPSPACDTPSPCGNGVTDPGEACDWKGNLGCGGPTLVCKPDCSGCTPGDEECTNARCTALGKNCGEMVVDGCGVVQCGDCEDPETCGGGGTPNVCGIEACKPSWECEQPLNGNEKDGCGNRRPNPACDALSLCGNGVKDAGEACDRQGDIGCNDPTPVCEKDCRGCTAANGALLFDGGFEPTDYWKDRNHWISDSWTPGYNSCLWDSDSLTVVADPKGKLGYVGRFEVSPEDKCNTPHERAEISYKHGTPEIGSNLFYGFSYMVPSSWVTLTTWGVLWQFHGETNPMVSINFDKGGISLTRNPSGVSGAIFTDKIFTTVVLNNWHFFVVRVRWTTDTTGSIQVWYKSESDVDYKEVLNLQDIQTRNPIPSPMNVWIQYGLYDGGTTFTKTIYHGNMKVGTTFASVTGS